MEEKEAAAVMDNAVATVAVALVQSTLMPGSGPFIRTRKSYTREEKLKLVTFYHKNSENMYQNCKRFQLNNRTVKRWVTNEKAIKESKKRRKRIMFERQAEHPGMEQKLYKEYKELRKKGLKVKRWWFMLRAKAILEDFKPDDSTYADTGDKTIWIRGGAAGLDKRQCKTQLTVFADGEPGVKLLLRFIGTGTMFESLFSSSPRRDERLDDYVNRTITARERRILFTKWVGQAWEEVSFKKEMIKRSFIKAGIAVAINGSQDDEINIEGLENYQVDVSDDESSDDPFLESDGNEDTQDSD
uniref:DDE-1 domain-containing protein n=1 Tax=Amphimedon queenslandica TaxID=400682 RepID=A0A1X7TTA4_AMPQE